MLTQQHKHIIFDVSTMLMYQQKNYGGEKHGTNDSKRSSSLHRSIRIQIA